VENCYKVTVNVLCVCVCVFSEELFNDLYCSPNIVLLVLEKGEVCTRFRWGNLRERDHLEGPDVDGKISKRIFSKWDGGTDWIDLAQ